MKTVARCIATWFFCGYAPAAPGTAGSVAAIVIAWLLQRYLSLTPPAFGWMATALFLPAVWAAGVTARESGNVVVDDPPDPSMEGIEERAALFQLVKRLPEDQRRVVVLRFVEQKSIREIAQELRRSEGAVKQLQFRALEKLRADVGGANG